MIKLANLTKFYGKSRGVIDLNFQVEKGEIFGFIGPNGAGKSTTIRTLLGLIHPSSGKAEIKGMNCTTEGKKIKKTIGYIPSEVNYYDDMHVKELFDYSARFYGVKNIKHAWDLSERLGLDITKKINALSFGNRKKVAIVQSLLHNPEILIYDEPTGGLDPLIQNVFFEIIKEEQKKGTTILFSSHVLSEVQKMCDRVAIIREGKLLKVESVSNLRKNNYRQVEIEYTSSEHAAHLDFEGITNASVSGSVIRFLYSGEVKRLISKINNQPIENILVEEPALEDIFMHYYMEGEKTS